MKVLLTAAVFLATLGAVAQQYSRASDGINVGLPIYRGAMPKPEGHGITSDRATLSFRDLTVEEAAGGKYITDDRSASVLDYYRSELKRYGTVTECSGGTNDRVSVSLDDSSISRLNTCRSDEFGEGETELKAGTADQFFVVTVRPAQGQTEFTLVRVAKTRKQRRPAGI